MNAPANARTSAASEEIASWFQPHVPAMAGYTPGEQPRGGNPIKLNTNENPYPPSPRVLEALRNAIDERLRLYPDPTATAYRQTVADVLGVDPAMVLAGNGSDDLLTILTRAFAGPGRLIVAPTPSYILYRTLAQLQNAPFVEVPYRDDWSLDFDAIVAHQPRLTLLANPNSPSGTALAPEHVGELAARLEGPLVVDEAYADFADANCLNLIARHPNVIVTRSLSKGYGLAGLRVGHLIARPEVVAHLNKVKDSYNCDALSIVGAAAALKDATYLAHTRRLVIATRQRLAQAMRSQFGCQVPESQANFVWCVGGVATEATYLALKERGILTRWMRYPGIVEGLRISVGTDEHIDQLLSALNDIVKLS
ncbi:histidinol phosphate aminotransferase apoenzyme [Isosphaera pallida ATCC 43644]|uniref:Histidinol-phosphate aminotransferase n=1 Tax=Isosphaera pallida (strain ATCC 43644 / DSM 9630 / IS1B) TaxID=575540 RepID=E8QYH8_ISOPI|nr:histidinol-phosphate transaminase [Isosphaera pallida]ADV64161.1 histidinol phosphate aminotransferase apoenzyme [Isosphaera pallida ATCC 43644]